MAWRRCNTCPTLPPGGFCPTHRFFYPPADPARETSWQPLYPDRLAEELPFGPHLTLPGHEADYPALNPGQRPPLPC
ncbi:hypothetical protein GCM10017687_12190 [Streptomyces echinatus]